MSYYQIGSSFGLGPNGNSLNSGDYERQAPLMQTQGGFRWREVAPNETVRQQLTQMLNNPDSNYIRNARSRGLAQGASRGLQNSSLAAASAEGAAIEGALPIAQQDAAWYGKTHADNMDAENQALLANLQSQTTLGAASMSAAAQRDIAQLNAQLDRERMAETQRQWGLQFGREGEQWNRAFEDSQNRYNTDWTRQQERDLQQHTWSASDFERQNEAGRQNFIGSSLINTIFSDPANWRDPQSALNFANTYGTNLNNLWQQIFGGGRP